MTKKSVLSLYTVAMAGMTRRVSVEYELYIDVWFLTNFTMDSVALMIAGKMMRERIRMGRLLLGSLAGTAGSMSLFFFLNDYTWYQLGVHFLVNPLMVWLCYRSRKWKQFLGQWFVTYLSCILLGGILTWGTANSALGGNLWLCLAGAFLFLFLAGKMLGQFRRQKETIYEILLVTGQGNLPARGFFDTGNLLMDPIVGKPVHIIKREILSEQIEKGLLPIRLIPFHSLGMEEGLLEAVTIEGMYILKEEQPLYLERPVLGLAKEKLFQDDRCDVILNGKSMNN